VGLRVKRKKKEDHECRSTGHGRTKPLEPKKEEIYYCQKRLRWVRAPGKQMKLPRP
jgi:hypothetical protein